MRLFFYLALTSSSLMAMDSKESLETQQLIKQLEQHCTALTKTIKILKESSTLLRNLIEEMNDLHRKFSSPENTHAEEIKNIESYQRHMQEVSNSLASSETSLTEAWEKGFSQALKRLKRNKGYIPFFYKIEMESPDDHESNLRDFSTRIVFSEAEINHAKRSLALAKVLKLKTDEFLNSCSQIKNIKLGEG